MRTPNCRAIVPDGICCQCVDYCLLVHRWLGRSDGVMRISSVLCDACNFSLLLNAAA